MLLMLNQESFRLVITGLNSEKADMYWCLHISNMLTHVLQTLGPADARFWAELL